MEKFYLVSLMITLPTSALALPNLTCASSGVENPYQVLLENGTATVTKNQEHVQFGNLYCHNRNTTHLVATCYSESVADAGFTVFLFNDANNSFIIDLYEESFVGSKLIAALSCWANSHA